MNESILVEKKNSIATIMLNEPESLNALSPKLRNELISVLLKVEEDEEIKVAIIAGKGKSFCAGGNIKNMREKMQSYEVKEGMDTSIKIIKLMRELSKPVISAVHGYAAGAGFSIALASDLVIAEEEAKFTLAFKNLGLVPDLGTHYFLANIIGTWKAKELIWRGNTITALEGERYGFINSIVPNGQALEVAQQLAVELAQGPSRAYAYTKSITNQSVDRSLNEILEIENFSQSILRGTKDNKEGIEAFLSKRTPRFTGE